MSSIRVEAENLNLNGYFVKNGNFASGGQYIDLSKPGNFIPGSTGTASYQFASPAGKYDIVVGYYDENDGIGELELNIDNVVVESWSLNDTTGDVAASTQSFRTRTIKGVELNPDRTITLKGTASNPAGEWARVDFIEFIPADETVTLGETITIEAETMNLTNYLVESGQSPASGNQLISLRGSGSNQGNAVTEFTGVTGNYNVEIGYFDENDGQASLAVQIGDARSDLSLNQNLGSDGVTSGNLVKKQIFSNLEIANGETINITGTSDQAEWARVDYIKFTPVTTEGEPIRLEAEDIIGNGYVIESNNVASNGQLVSLFRSGNSQGSLSTQFNGATGNYKVKLGFYDENDGQSSLTAQIGNSTYNLNLDRNLNADRATSETFVEFTLDENIAITQGDNITLTGTADAGEWARVDYIEFIPLDNNNQPPTSTTATDGDDILAGNSQNNTLDALAGNDVIKPGAGNNVIDGGLGIDTVSYDYDTAGVTVNLGSGVASRKFTTSDDEQFKILPLGDSNTRGYPYNVNNGGYRTKLWTDLAIEQGFNLDFVGSATNGPSNIDRNHEGRGGLTIDQLTDNVNGYPGLNDPEAGIYTNIEDALSDDPDMVLLMAGTNDILKGDSVNDALDQLGTLVDRITADSPNTKVLVASVIPSQVNSTTEARTAEFSSRIEDEIVNPRSTQGDNVVFVDIYNAPLNNSNFTSDGIHLTQNGYDKLADVWSEAILNTDGGTDTLTNIENIDGSAYNDTLAGDAGVNVINGRDGNDRLQGGGGNDILTGGLGSDTFVLASGDGNDTITDFTVGQDSVGLLGSLSFEQIAITQGTGANADNSSIKIAENDEILATLNGVQAGDLSISDFTSIS
ncbi:MAG: SGNH/GDSL hydrolase family protein [Xenococcaceae cyanobacterium]